MSRNVLAGRGSKWFLVGFWIILVGALSPLAAKLSDASSNDASSWLPQSAEATRAVERAQNAFPASTKLLAVVVYARDDGLTGADRDKADADRAAFAGYADGGQVSPLIPSEDGKALLISFPIAGDDETQAAAIIAVKDRLAQAPDGLRAALTGSAGAVDDIVDVFSGLDTTLLFVTAGVVALLLLITYRSPILWFVPLVSVGVASQLAERRGLPARQGRRLTVNGQSRHH